MQNGSKNQTSTLFSTTILSLITLHFTILFKSNRLWAQYAAACQTKTAHRYKMLQ